MAEEWWARQSGGLTLWAAQQFSVLRKRNFCFQK